MEKLVLHDFPTTRVLSPGEKGFHEYGRLKVSVGGPSDTPRGMSVRHEAPRSRPAPGECHKPAFSDTAPVCLPSSSVAAGPMTSGRIDNACPSCSRHDKEGRRAARSKCSRDPLSRRLGRQPENPSRGWPRETRQHRRAGKRYTASGVDGAPSRAGRAGRRDTRARRQDALTLLPHGLAGGFSRGGSFNHSSPPPFP